ncbi:hypothetical protein ACSXC4_14965 (plasmid) [Clostridium perfringens]|uniref:hypothetical protein n=1 Tax=Clostridium perfringens TaxID=1502 RepID=UPI00096A2C73|nr:hypothetical protein [Clostridium perfringens]NGU65299.1 hypothetical protein [Clostridium perfringens]
MNVLKCEYCGHEEAVESFDGVILLIKEKGTQKKVDVKVCCKEKCHDSLEKLALEHGFNTGFFELLNGLKFIYSPEDFSPKALEKYENILSKFN